MAEEKKYLDRDGVVTLWSKIKQAVAGKLSETEVNNLISTAITNLHLGSMSTENTTNYYTKSAVNDLIDAINQFQAEIVASLPSTGNAGTIYLVPVDATDTTKGYIEYLYISNQWEVIGNTQIDLSYYATKADLATKVGKTDYATTSSAGVVKIGTTITISNGVINVSATIVDKVNNHETAIGLIQDELGSFIPITDAEIDTICV